MIDRVIDTQRDKHFIKCKAQAVHDRYVISLLREGYLFSAVTIEHIEGIRYGNNRNEITITALSFHMNGVTSIHVQGNSICPHPYSRCHRVSTITKNAKPSTYYWFLHFKRKVPIKNDDPTYAVRIKFFLWL